MRIIGHHVPLPLGNPNYLAELALPVSQPQARRPVGRRLRRKHTPNRPRAVPRGAALNAPPLVLGYDVAGEMIGRSEAAQLFEVGALVCYAGSPAREENGELQLVNERALAPYGAICTIDCGGHQVNLAPLVGTGARLMTQGVFNRQLHRREPERRHQALERIATFVETGQITPLPQDDILSLNVGSLAEAHRKIAERERPLRLALAW